MSAFAMPQIHLGFQDGGSSILVRLRSGHVLGRLSNATLSISGGKRSDGQNILLRCIPTESGFVYTGRPGLEFPGAFETLAFHRR